MAYTIDTTDLAGLPSMEPSVFLLTVGRARRLASMNGLNVTGYTLCRVVPDNGRVIAALWMLFEPTHADFCIVVDEGYRNQGIGSELVGIAERLTYEEGIDRIEVMVMSRDMERLLTELGYRRKQRGRFVEMMKYVNWL